MGDVSAGLGLAKTLAGLFALSTGGFAAPKRRRRADGGVNDLGDVDLGNEDASPEAAIPAGHGLGDATETHIAGQKTPLVPPSDLPTPARSAGLAPAEAPTATSLPSGDEAPLPPPRPAGLNAPVATAARTPDDSDQNPVQRAGTAVSSGITSAVEGAGRAVQQAGHGFLTALGGAESGNRNIWNTHQTTNSGRAGGLYQITTGTWNDFAPRAGVDLSQYSDPTKAPPEVQAAVAANIPMGRWDPITLRKLEAEGFQIDPSKTMAENARMNGDLDPRQFMANADNGGGGLLGGVGSAISGGLGNIQHAVGSVFGGGQPDQRDFQAQAQGGQGSQNGDQPNVGQKAGDWFGQNRSWLVPLLGGVGAMASSPSRYLGAALLQGAGAGAQAYAGEQQSEANLANTQAQTRGQDISNLTGLQNVVKNGFYSDSAGREWVMTTDGHPISKSLWMQQARAGSAPPIIGESAVRAQLGLPGATNAPSPYRGPAAPATQPGSPAGDGGSGYEPPLPNGGSGQVFPMPTPQAPVTSAQAASGVGSAGMNVMKTNFDTYQNSPGQLAELKPESNHVATEINAAGNAARGERGQLHQLTDQLLQLPDTGALAGGVVHDIRARGVAYYNSVLDGLELPPDQIRKLKIDPNESDTGVIADKLSRVQQFMTSSGYHQNSLGGLEQALTATPGTNMTKGAAMGILSGLYATEQRNIDRMNYLADWRNKVDQNYPGMGQFYANQDAMRAFEQDHPLTQYGTEKAAFNGALTNQNKKTKQPLFSDLYHGRTKASTLDEVTRRPGMSRWLTGE